MEPIYLDHNAATTIRPEAVETLVAVLSEIGNPASPHRYGRRTLERLESDRAAIAQRFHAGTVLFTSGGTEACNLAIQGICHAKSHHGAKRKLLISSAEHAAILEPALALLDTGVELRTLPLNSDGTVNRQILRQWGDPDTNLVAVQWVSHETGVVQPLSQIAAICDDWNVPLHVDAVAAAGKIPVGFTPEIHGVTSISIAAHKFGGPCGVGALLVRDAFDSPPIRPLLYGGSQEFSTRAGTPPVAMIAAMRVAIELAIDEIPQNLRKLTRLRDRFETAMRTKLPFCTVIAADSLRSPYTSAIAFVGYDSRNLVRQFDEVGVCCATGAACSSNSNDPSPVLRAMQLSDEIVHGTVRFSFSPKIRDDEIDEAVRRMVRVFSHGANG